MMENITLFERIKGSLVGCAYGDAMGMPTEMMRPEKIQRLFPEGVNGLEPSTSEDFINRHFQAGEVTDDTVNTILVLKTIISNDGEFDTRKYIDSLLEWVKENGDKNPYIMGPNTLKAITAIQKGADINETGKFSTTNGSAMKVSPIGIIYDYREADEFIGHVYDLCLPTHNTSIAISGAAGVASAVSYAIRGGKDIDEMWNIAISFIEKAKAKGNQLPSADLVERMKSIKDVIDSVPFETAIKKLQNFYGTGVETIETIPAVFGVVKLSNGDPLKSAQICANLGGDTDTIGAIATAICGAMNPISDQRIIDILQNVNGIDFEELAQKAESFIK